MDTGSLTVADVLVAALRRHEVDVIFGQSLPTLAMLAAERGGIRQVGYRTESAGGAMADGYARMTGRVAVVSAQNGPAAVLLVAPLAEALKASVPVIALVQDVPVGDRERNAFQEFDHHALFAPVAKWIGELHDPSRVDDYVDAAFRQATSDRPGPAVLLLPKDRLAEPASKGKAARRQSLGRFPLDRMRPDDATIHAAAELLAQAQHPLVIAGGGVHLSGAASALAELQQLAYLPVATTTMGKGSVDETHPLSVGLVGSFMGEHSLTRSQRRLIDDADVIVLIGTRTNENGTDAWTLLPNHATYLHIDIDPVEIGRNYPAIRLAGDAKAVLAALADQLNTVDLTRRRDQYDELANRIQNARAADAAAAAVVTASDATPIRPERLMTELNCLLTDQTVVVSDASYASIWMPAYLHARRPGQRFLAPRGLAGLGWGLPLALGAQAADPQAPVVCITGDGGFAHCWAELETAVREHFPVTVIVLANGILGYQKHAELVQYGAHTSAINLASIDHVAIAQACGVHATRIEKPRQLIPALTQALANPQPNLIEVVTEPDAYPPITAWDHNDQLTQDPGHAPDVDG